jgi:hypothetical protein
MKLASGFAASLTFIAFRWNNIKKRSTKFAIMLASMFALFALYVFSQVGNVIIQAASGTNSNIDESIKSIALMYLNSFQNNESFVIVSAILAASVSMMIITPFSVYNLGGIVSSRELSIVKSNENYKMSDSIIVQAISSLSILQLFSFTMLGSILTIEGGTALGIFFTWSIWLAVTFITTAFMWVLEYVNRRFGNKAKILTVAVLIGIVGVVVIFDDMKGLTFFGLSPIIVNIVQNIGVSFTVFQIVGAFGFPLALIILSSGLINFFAPHTLVLPEPVIVKKEKEVSNNIISRRATINFNNLFNLLVFRYKALWRPILITTGMASLFILLLSNEGSVIVGSLVIITPLIVGMSFGVNMFGVIGNANGWFVSQPYWRKTVLWRLLGVQLNIIGLAYLILLTPSLLFGRLSFVDVVNLLPAMTVIALVMSVFGVYKSTVKPVKYSPSQR